MRFAISTFIAVILTLTLAIPGMAQHIGCDDLVKSAADSLRLPYLIEGVPGDTLLLPVTVKNDSLINAFRILIQYDSTWLTPITVMDSVCAAYDEEGTGACTTWTRDSSYIDFAIADRWLKEEVISYVPYQTDTVTSLIVHKNRQYPGIIEADLFPNFELDSDTIFAGSAPIFYIKFVIDPDMPEMQTSEFTFFESDNFIVDTTIFPPDTTWFDGCSQSEVGVLYRDAEDPDVINAPTIYPTTHSQYPYFFRANSNVTDDPEVTSFAASPAQITPTQSSTLSWTSESADSVVITLSGNRVTGTANGQTAGSITVSGLSVGTYSYTATAYADDGLKTHSRGTSVVVSDEVVTEGPDVTISTIQSSYNQGELITFTVTATNTNGSQITINANSLPANAGFGVGGQVTGMTPLIGNFSWTPDFTQAGGFTIPFVATDNDGTTTEYANIVVEELDRDRLFSTSARGSQPVGGLPGADAVAFPIDLITASTVYGVQFDMLYPSAQIRVDSFVTTARIPEYVVYENIGQTPGEIRVVTFGLNNEPVMDTNTTAILNAMLTIDDDAQPWQDYKIYLENGRESINPDPNVGSLELVTDSGIVEVDSLGDVNLDRYIDVADVVNIVATIIGSFTLTDRQFDVADIIENGEVNVFDLVADINMIYEIQPSPSPAPPAPGVEAIIALAYDDVSQGGSDFLTVSSEIPHPVAGVQLELNYDPAAISLGVPRLTNDDQDFVLRSNDNGVGSMKILLYNMSPMKDDELIQAGTADLVEIPIIALTDIAAGDKTKLRLTEALLSTSEAASISVQGIDKPLPSSFVLEQNYPNPFNPTTTIEYSVGISGSGNGSQHVRLDVFNILGQHVDKLIDAAQAPGQYSVEWNATDRNGKRVATGIYLYRLSVDDEKSTKKMLFLK